MEIISEETGDSPKQVQRYIKMADLIPELLEKVDDGSMGFTPAVQIAYLKKKEQGTYFYIHCSLYNPYLNNIGFLPPTSFNSKIYISKDLFAALRSFSPCSVHAATGA